MLLSLLQKLLQDLYLPQPYGYFLGLLLMAILLVKL